MLGFVGSIKIKTNFHLKECADCINTTSVLMLGFVGSI